MFSEYCQATSRQPLVSEKPDIEKVYASLQLGPIERQDILGEQAAVCFDSELSLRSSA